MSTGPRIILDEFARLGADAPPPPARHTAGHATYPGDCRHAIGEVMGPTNYGVPVVVIAATYDDAAKTTRVTFGHLTQDELLLVATGQS